MMLEHVNRLQRPVVSRKVKIAVHVAAVLPAWREATHSFIDGAFLDPKARVGPQLQIERMVTAGNFMRPISEGDLDNMKHDIRAGLHVKSEIMKILSSTLPAVRVAIHRDDVQLLSLGIFDELAMNVWVFEYHSQSPQSCAAGPVA
jgi:hypothetical protein